MANHISKLQYLITKLENFFITKPPREPQYQLSSLLLQTIMNLGARLESGGEMTAIVDEVAQAVHQYNLNSILLSA
jgi:hypothetical protein